MSRITGFSELDGLPVRKEFAATQNIFSTEAVIITEALPDEKIFNSPLATPLRRLHKVSIRKPEIYVYRITGFSELDGLPVCKAFAVAQNIFRRKQ